MTVINPEPANTKAPEPKVKAATVGSYAAGAIGLFLVNLLTGAENELILASIPDWAEALILPVLPAIVAFGAAYNAKHQWRVRPGASGGASGSTELG